MKILLDTSAYRRTVVREIGIAEQIVEIFGRPQPVRMVQERAVEPKNVGDAGEVEALRAIFDLARASREIQFGVSWELRQEFFRGTQKSPASGGDLAEGIDFESVPSPLERGMFFSLPSDEYASKEIKKKFIEFICQFGERPEEFPRRGVGGYKLNEYELGSLQTLGRFAKACEVVPEAQWFDLFHLWTAERAGYQYFLTRDKKFVNLITQTCRIEFDASPITPIGLWNLLSSR